MFHHRLLLILDGEETEDAGVVVAGSVDVVGHVEVDSPLLSRIGRYI